MWHTSILLRLKMTKELHEPGEEGCCLVISDHAIEAIWAVCMLNPSVTFGMGRGDYCLCFVFTYTLFPRVYVLVVSIL